MNSVRLFKNFTWIIAGLLLLVSCQKEDIIDRLIPSPGGFRPKMLTSLVWDSEGTIVPDSVFWFQNASGHIDSASTYDSTIRRRKKILGITRMPGTIWIDDGELGLYRAKVIYDMMNYPSKVEFYNRQSGVRLSHSYNFYYDVQGNLYGYCDSVKSKMHMEAYGSFFGYSYPHDSFYKVSIKGNQLLSESTIHNVIRGPDLSSFRFVPFISPIISSNLANRSSTAIHRNVFDCYIWGEVMRSWTNPRAIISFDETQDYPIPLPTYTQHYDIQISPGFILYSDGERTVKNFYP